MSFSEAALAKRADRTRYLECFPGRLPGWDAAVGKTVAAVARIAGRVEQLAVAFSDGTFLLTRPAEMTPEAVEAALVGLRAILELHHAAAFATLDRLQAEEAEAMRLARMEKVLGAVQSNLPQIPELRSELLRILGVNDAHE
jgi:diglucosylglycerate octanoyltransferase